MYIAYWNGSCWIQVLIRYVVTPTYLYELAQAEHGLSRNEDC